MRRNRVSSEHMEQKKDDHIDYWTLCLLLGLGVLFSYTSPSACFIFVRHEIILKYIDL